MRCAPVSRCRSSSGTRSPAPSASSPRNAGAFDPDTVKLFRKFASEIEFGIATMQDRRRDQQNLEQLAVTLEAAVAAVAASTEFDPYTAGHQRGVAKIAVTIAQELGLGAEETKGIEVAAMLHDIGKIVVPAQILSKPAKLSAAEFELIKAHPQAGVDIVAGIDFPWPVARTILQHHERLDGSGYPFGLKGDEIHLGAWIVMVADVLEAMTSPWAYRPAASVADALGEIEKESGTRYDCDVAAALRPPVCGDEAPAFRRRSGLLVPLGDGCRLLRTGRSGRSVPGRIFACRSWPDTASLTSGAGGRPCRARRRATA